MLLLPCLVIYLVSFMQIQAAVLTETYGLSGQCGKSYSFNVYTVLVSLHCHSYILLQCIESESLMVFTTIPELLYWVIHAFLKACSYMNTYSKIY